MVKLVLSPGHPTGRMSVKLTDGTFVSVTAQGICVAQELVPADVTGRLSKLIEVRAADAVDEVLSKVSEGNVGSLVPAGSTATDEAEAKAAKEAEAARKKAERDAEKARKNAEKTAAKTAAAKKAKPAKTVAGKKSK